MVIQKTFHVSLLTAVCIAINWGGKYIAVLWNLPFWMDSLGTACGAYLLGPWCGAIIGATSNIISGFRDPMSFVYSLVSIASGLIIGFCARNKLFRSLLGTHSVAVLVTISCTLLSTPLNCFLYQGYTGNVWGDGILNMLKDWDVDWIISALIAEFFLEFLDKTITLVFLYIVIHAARRYREKHSPDAKRLGVLLIPLLLLPCTAVNAKAEPVGDASYIQTVYSNESGLLSGEANDIAASGDSVLWIGTYAGLYRYTGTTFRYMSEFESVKNVNCLYTDEEGRLWIGTNDDGLTICISESVANVLNEDASLPSNSVRSIVQQSSGKYFVGTSDALAVVSLSGGISVSQTIPEITYASCLAADDDNHIAAVTATGELFLIDGYDITSHPSRPAPDILFTCCYFDDSGNLMAGTDNGEIYLYRISGGQLQLKKHIACSGLQYINSISADNSGRIFLCADNGVGYLDGALAYHHFSTGSFNSSIDHMTVDYQGNLWFSSSRLGVLRLSPSPFTELYREAGMEESVVNSTALWQGRLYIGTDNGLDILTLDDYSPVADELTQHLNSSRIRCLTVDDRDNLWICAYGKGILQVAPDGTVTTYTAEDGAVGSKFRSCIQLKDGSMAVSSELGISFIQDGKVTGTISSDDGLTNPLVLCLLQQEDGTILAGTDGGGIAVIRSGRPLEMLTRKDGLCSGVILRLVADSDDGSTYIIASNGVCLLSADGTIKELTNIPYSNSYDICDNGRGQLFLSGSAGIYVMDKAALLAGEEGNYELLNNLAGLRASLTANAWNCVDDDQTWYICTGKGVVTLNLNNYRNTIRSYRMLLQSVHIDGVSHQVDRSEPIALPRGTNRLDIHPEIVNYSTEDPYIRYYMEGVDPEPVIVRQSEFSNIIYTNLPSGVCHFRLAVLGNDRQTVMEEQIYTIIKENELYDNLWFKICFFAELVMIIAWFTWFITKTIFQRRLELQRREIEIVREQVRMGNETILAIAKTVDAKDSNTSQHSTRVSEYSAMIAQRLGYSEAAVENLRKMALLHDIGKIGIPDSVLNKPGRLTDEEYEQMRAHVTIGAEILKDFTLVENVRDGALYHHERYDGTGYVSGLKGEEIPESARIIGVADAFDAMTANRVYRRKLEFSHVISELEKGRGTQFDPQMVDILLDLIREGAIHVQNVYREEDVQL